jgi:hypothetical protein
LAIRLGEVSRRAQDHALQKQQNRRSLMKNQVIPYSHPTRREFLKTSAGVAATALAPSMLGQSALGAEPAAAQKTIGIQAGSISFVDEGMDRVLDILQERGAVDTIYLTTFTYGRGLAGRQIPGQPFPDHGVQESDEKFFRGGNFATPHAEFYQNTVLK